MTGPDTPPSRRGLLAGNRASYAYLGLGIAVALAYFLLPSGGQVASYLGLLAATTILVAWRIGARIRDLTWPWLALLVGQTVYFMAVLLWYAESAFRNEDFPAPSFEQPVVFVVYAAFAIGYTLFCAFLVGRVLLTRGTSERFDLLDALAVTLALSGLLWVLFIHPVVEILGSSPVGAVGSGAYLAVLLPPFVAGVFYLQACDLRCVASWLIVAWVLAQLVADLLDAVSGFMGPLSPDGQPFVVGWLLANGCLGALVLRGDFDTATGCRPEGRESRLRRIVVLGATFALLAVAVAWGVHGPWDHLLLGVLAALALGAALLRISRLGGTVEEFQRIRGELERRNVELTESADKDRLTGLAIRSAMMTGWETAAADRSCAQQTGVLVLDLDDFAAINEEFGDREGDAALVETANRIRAAARPEDLAARTGSDEFALLLCDAGMETTIAVAERLTEDIKRPIESAAAPDLELSASMGVVVLNPGDDPRSALQLAELARAGARQRGGGRYEVYDERVHGRIESGRVNAMELRRAASRGQLVLHYQPLFDLRTLDVIGAEALVRWNHPSRGLLPPGAFIADAEASGVIDEIGAWVLREACSQGARWERERAVGANETEIAVNVSRVQLQDPGLMELVRAELAETGLPPRLLQLEVTESALSSDREFMLGQLDALHALGVGLSLDDFGTGYSSMSELRRLPIDVMKIDKAFVDGVATSSEEWRLTAAIAGIAVGLSKRTIAEGIETAPQLAHLRSLGIDWGQGYLFSKPVPLEQFDEIRKRGTFALERPSRS